MHVDVTGRAGDWPGQAQWPLREREGAVVNPGCASGWRQRISTMAG
jgi:hypothetical protein